MPQSFEHFREIEELKDEIALAMIDRTKEFKIFFMKRLEPQTK